MESTKSEATGGGAGTGAGSAPPWLPANDGAPGTPAGPRASKRRRSAWAALSAALFAVVIIGSAVLVGEWAARTAEADALIDQIERSEAAMVTAMGTVSAALAQEPDPEGGLSDGASRTLRAAAAGAADEIAAASDALTGQAIQPWHVEAVAARDAYLAHSAAWQAFLADAGDDPTVWFVEDAAIASTWDAFGPTLEQSLPGPALPWLSARVAAILDDSGDPGNGGGTLQAQGRTSPVP